MTNKVSANAAATLASLPQLKPSEGIPYEIQRMIVFHLSRLVDEVKALQGVERARGRGHHFTLELDERDEAISHAIRKLEQLHTLAITNECEDEFIDLTRTTVGNTSMGVICNQLPQWMLCLK